MGEGQKIQAIKVYRERTGVGLKQAKEAVEAIERGEPLPIPEMVDESFERELIALLDQGQKIEAIKLYRDAPESDSRKPRTPLKPSSGGNASQTQKRVTIHSTTPSSRCSSKGGRSMPSRSSVK